MQACNRQLCAAIEPVMHSTSGCCSSTKHHVRLRTEQPAVSRLLHDESTACLLLKLCSSTQCLERTGWREVSTCTW